MAAAGGAVRCSQRMPRMATTCGCATAAARSKRRVPRLRIATGRWRRDADPGRGADGTAAWPGGLLGNAPAGVGSGRTATARWSSAPPTSSPLIARAEAGTRELGREGYLIRSVVIDGHAATVIAANGDIGVLYGAFHFLRLLQTRQPIARSGRARIAEAATAHAQSLGQSRRHGRARLRRRVALGLAHAARTISTRATPTTPAPTPRSASTAPC